MKRSHTALFIGIALGFLVLIAVLFYFDTDKTNIALVSAFFSIVVIAIAGVLAGKNKRGKKRRLFQCMLLPLLSY